MIALSLSLHISAAAHGWKTVADFYQILICNVDIIVSKPNIAFTGV